MELYIRKLLYLDMNKHNYTKILKSIRKPHWEEQERVFSRPAKVKYGNIHLLAILVSALYRYHQEFVIGVIGNILESTTLGLEQNDFKFNQKRIAETKYLGELYNYKMINSPVIFDALYRIVTFGLYMIFFRIHLICTLLDTCGVYFDRGFAKKLDFFLTFFQYYIFTKDQIPMDVDFLIQDTYSLEGPADYGLDEDVVPDADEEQSTSEADASGTNVEQDADSESEEEHIFVARQEELDPETEAEFDRAFEKMLTESLESRRFELKVMFHHRYITTPDNNLTRTIELPSDSSFAVAMKTQQQAHHEEQQQIKKF
ncbi:Armadillo-type fold [Elaphomyces granulatus]